MHEHAGEHLEAGGRAPADSSPPRSKRARACAIVSSGGREDPRHRADRAGGLRLEVALRLLGLDLLHLLLELPLDHLEEPDGARSVIGGRHSAPRLEASITAPVIE